MLTELLAAPNGADEDEGGDEQGAEAEAEDLDGVSPKNCPKPHCSRYRKPA